MGNIQENGLSTGKIVGIGFLSLFLILGLGWMVQGNNFLLYKFFAPKQEQVRRETFEQSRAFNQGMVQELQNMQFEYLKQTDLNAKASMADIILHRASGYNLNDSLVTADLRSFIDKLKQEKAAAR